MTSFSDRDLEFALESSIWSSASNSMEPPKKKRIRARLDHMTPEEKRERRKEKNRQAAQTARDRKRTRLEKLEEENQRLREENMRLRGAILGNSRDQSVVKSSAQVVSSSAQAPVIQITDSGISDVDTKSGTSQLSSLYVKDNNHLNIIDGSDGRTMTPDSSYNYGTSVVSPASSDDNFIDSIIERDNDVALVNEVRELVSYVNGDSGDGVSLGSAAGTGYIDQIAIGGELTRVDLSSTYAYFDDFQNTSPIIGEDKLLSESAGEIK
uniref:X-box-binding protein 1 n=1 Tax=Aceria tosichella TaxID=561515 RepID=A0A6G1SNW0_9ACAR